MSSVLIKVEGEIIDGGIYGVFTCQSFVSDQKLQMALKFEISSSFFKVGIQGQALRSAFQIEVAWQGKIASRAGGYFHGKIQKYSQVVTIRLLSKGNWRINLVSNDTHQTCWPTFSSEMLWSWFHAVCLAVPNTTVMGWSLGTLSSRS